MTQQLDLFNHAPRARASDPATSHQAAERVRHLRPSLRRRILEVLDGNPMSDDEICVALNVDVRQWPSVKTARSALTHCVNPKIVPAGIVLRGQQVWKLAPVVEPYIVDVPVGSVL